MSDMFRTPSMRAANAQARMLTPSTLLCRDVLVQVTPSLNVSPWGLTSTEFRNFSFSFFPYFFPSRPRFIPFQSWVPSKHSLEPCPFFAFICTLMPFWWRSKEFVALRDLKRPRGIYSLRKNPHSIVGYYPRQLLQWW